MTAPTFNWSPEHDAFVLDDPTHIHGFPLTVSFSAQDVPSAQRERLLLHAAGTFPALLAAEPALKKAAYKQITTDISADDWPPFKVFQSSMALAEACLVDAADCHLYYRGTREFEGWAITVFCKGLMFHAAELARERGPREREPRGA